MKWVLVYWVFNSCNSGFCDPVSYEFKAFESEENCVWAMQTFQELKKDNRAVCIRGDSEWVKEAIAAQER